MCFDNVKKLGAVQATELADSEVVRREHCELDLRESAELEKEDIGTSDSAERRVNDFLVVTSGLGEAALRLNRAQPLIGMAGIMFAVSVQSQSYSAILCDLDGAWVAYSKSFSGSQDQ